LAKIDPDNAAEYLTHACAEAPESREPWIDMAQLGYRLGDWLLCLHSALAALNIKTRPLAYLNDPQAWGPLPHDLAAIAAHHLGYRHEALYHGTQAVRLNPYETRLSMNLNHYREAAA
jgi:hypothetical protein